MQRTSLRVAVSLLCASALAAPVSTRAAAQLVARVDLSTLAGTSPQQHPAVAFDGARHLVAWEEAGAIWAALLEASGASAVPRFALAPPPSGTTQQTPAVAASSTGGFLVVWAEAGGATGWNVRAVRVSQGGTAAVPFDVSVVDDGSGVLSPATGDQLAPAVASGGGEFLVVWEDGRSSTTAPDVYGAVIAADGTNLDPGGFPICAQANAQRRPAIASSGSDYLVVWEDALVGGESDVYAARVSLQGVAEPEFAVTSAVGDQVRPAIASSAPGYVVAWNDGQTGARQVVAVRAGTSGVLDPTGIAIGSVDAAAPHAVASDGSSALVVYERTGAGAIGARLSAAGAAGPEFALDATAPVVPLGEALAYGGAGRYLAIAVEQPADLSRLAGFLVTTFEPLTVVVQGSGGSVSSTPPGISCGSQCAAEFATGSAVTLQAALQAGATLQGWSVASCGTATTCAVTMAGPLTVTATFAQDPPPAAPAAPTYSDVGSTSVRVGWIAVAGATSYALERGVAAGGPWTAAGTGGAATTFVDFALSPNTTYWYRVTASNATGAGTPSAPSSVTTGPPAPGAPTFTDVRATSVALTWSAASGATEYVVERSGDAGTTWTSVGTSTTLAWTDTSVAPSTSYAYRVRGKAAATGDASAAASVTTLPLPPAAPATPSCGPVGETTVNVAWTSVAGAVTYDVERGDAASANWASAGTKLAGTTFTDTGRSANTTYSYRVRGSNTGGDGAFSTPCSATTLPAAPGAPSFTSVTTSSAIVSWTAPTGGATAYSVERATGTATTWTVLASGFAATTFTDSSLAANTSYRYRVRAWNASGAGAYSAESAVATTAGVPGTPTFSAVTATSLVVSWTAPVGGATSYELQRAASAAGPFTTVATPAAPPVTDSGLTVGTTYWYQVRAVNGTGTSAWSAVGSAPTLPGAPGPLAFSSVTSSSVVLTWAAAAGAVSYKVERAPDAGNAPGTWGQIAGGVIGTTYTSAGLAANVKYWYRVRATNASGDGAYDVAASLTTLPNAPGSPTFSTVTTTSLTVSWTAPSGGASSYVLERGPSASGPWTVLASGTALSYADSGLTAGTAYWYRVTAVNADGQMSPPASRSVITLPGAPAAPTFSSITATTLSVSWTPVTGAATYRLERAPDAGGVAGTWAQISATAASTYADSGLAPNTRYWYRLRAENASGLGAYSPGATVMTLPNAPAFASPAFSSVTKTSLVVTWTAPTGGAATYELQRATSSGLWTAIVPSTTAVTWSDGTLVSGTTYSYRVRAVNVDGGMSDWSQVATTTTLPDAPGAPTFTGVSTVALTVNWTAVTGATSYHVERSPDVAGQPQPDGWALRAIVADTYFNDVGTANTVYWYRVRAATAGGYGDYSLSSSVATLANAPGKPTFTNVTTTSVTVSWTAPTGGAASFVVERAADQLGTYTAVTTGVTSPTWTDTTLSPGTTYWYRIRAVNATGTIGAPSIAASVTTVPAAPSGAPGTPTYSAIAATSVTVSWTDTSGATSYRLERAADANGAPGAWTLLATQSARSYTDRTLAANTVYWYRVRGSTAGGDGGYSEPSFVWTAPGAPGTPSVTSVGTTTVGLAWTEPAGGAASYSVERAGSSAGPWVVIGEVSGRALTDSGLTAGATYWYRIQARNGSGTGGAYSVVKSATTLAAPPGGPTYSNITASSVTLSWSAAEGATRYNVERSTGSTGAWSQIATSVTTTSFVSIALAANTVYGYRVSAVNAAGAPGPYSPATTVTTAPGAPGAPTFGAPTTTAVTLTWTAPAGGAATYAIDRAPTSTGPWTTIARGLTATSYADATLVASSTYWYRIRAANAQGLEGSPSAARSITTAVDSTSPPATAPGAPTFASITAASLRVSWTAAPNATSYALERSLGTTGAWALIATLASTSFTDGPLSANTAYSYRVRGSNAAGAGPVSGVSSTMTAPNAPAAPTFGTPTASSVGVSWTAPAGGAAAYRLERAPSALGPWAVVVSGVSATTFTDAPLSANTTYSYRLRAANALGAEGAYSSPASVTTAADLVTAKPGVPGTPTLSSVTSSSLKVSWTAATGATSYKVQRATAAAGPFSDVAVVTATSLTDTGRAANTAYWYRVVGSNAGGDGAASDAATTLTAPNVPGTPTFAALAPTSVTVSWAVPSGGAATYALERATYASGPWTVVASGLATNTRIDSGLAGNTTYHYRVRAASSAGTLSAYSWTAAVTTPPDGVTATPSAPDAPVYSNVTQSSLHVLWGAVTGATTYDVERALGTTSPGTFAVRASGLTATAFVDSGLAANTRYWYRVRGASAGGKGAASTASSVVTLPGTPGAPAFSSVGSTSLTVSWSAPSGGAASYKVERATSPYGPWVQLSTGSAATSYADAGLLASTTYSYRIRATNSDGIDGSASAAVSTTTAPDATTPVAGAPGAPQLSSIAATSLRLSWTTGAGATSYAVERATAAAGPWTQVASVSGTSYGDSGLSANTTYWYRVRGVNALGPGLVSDATSGTTLPNAPAAPTLSAVTDTTVTVSWTVPAGGAATYQVERSQSAAGPFEIAASGLTGLTFNDTGLTPSTTWYYRVRAANSAGATGTPSLTRSITTAAVPGA